MPSRTCRPGIPPDGDGGAMDAGRDAAAPPDAATRDSSHLDASRDLDAGGADAGRADSGPVDAGPLDGGPPDAGPDDTRCDDLHAGAIFCDGFETAPGFPAWSSMWGTDGMVSRTTTQTFLGLGALRAQTTVGGGHTAVRRTLATPLTSGEVYLRAFVFIPSSVTSMGSFSIAQAGYDGSPWYHVSLGTTSAGAAQLYLDSEAGGRSVNGRPIPRDVWVCLEAHVFLADTGGFGEMWMNGTHEGRFSDFNTSPARGYERVAAGLPYTEPTRTTTDVYVDEVVLSRTRIGCD